MDAHREDFKSKLAKLRSWLAQRPADGILFTTANEAPRLEREELAGDLAQAAWSAGIEPLVLNMATDERAFLFRHAIPTARKIERYGVFSVCLRRFGLHVTLTRSVHFGPIPGELSARHRVACTLEAFAKPGASLGFRRTTRRRARRGV